MKKLIVSLSVLLIVSVTVNIVLERSLEEIIQYTKDYRYEVTDCCNLVREEYDKARIEYTE